jgi:hypothetical protein
MGALEEGGKVASGTVEALKAQPLALALVVVNVMFLVAAAWFLHDLAGNAAANTLRKDKLVAEMMERCLLSTPPPAKDDRP